MDNSQAQKRIKSMIDLIKQEAEDKASQIRKDAESTFNSEKEKFFNSQINKIKEQYRLKLEQYVVQKRIQRSKIINAARLQKMNARHEVTMKIKEDAKQQLIQKLSSDKQLYKELLKKMIVQGMIKLMEKELQVRSRKEDHAHIEPILEECAQMFKDIVKKETNVDFPINLILDKNNVLPENTVKVGGVILAAHKGRILCINTIDNRLDLCFQDSIPDIRRIMFPDLTLPPEKKEIVHKKH